LPLGTKVLISLLPLEKPAKPAQNPSARAKKRTGLDSTHCQTNLFG